MRRDGRLDADEARDLWLAIDEIDSDITSGEALYYHLASDDYSTLIEFLGDNVHELFVSAPTADCLFLRNSLIPFFRDYLKEHLAKASAATA